MGKELVLFCVAEARAVAKVSGKPGERVTKALLADGLEMVDESASDERRAILTGSKHGREVLCPYCGNRLALAVSGQSVADITSKPIRLPLGSFRIPE